MRHLDVRFLDSCTECGIVVDLDSTKAKQMMTNLIIKLDKDDHRRIVEKLNKPLNIDITNQDENHL